MTDCDHGRSSADDQDFVMGLVGVTTKDPARLAAMPPEEVATLCHHLLTGAWRLLAEYDLAHQQFPTSDSADNVASARAEVCCLAASLAYDLADEDGCVEFVEEIDEDDDSQDMQI